MAKYVVDVDGLRIGNKYPVRLMGILNLSPESFYKETIATKKSAIRDLILRMENGGVDIIDIGAASTAPKNVYGTPEVSEKEELSRLTHVLGMITDSTNLPLSIDTVSSKVAEVAIDMGVVLVNDISGLQADSRMASLVHSKDIPIVLMANCGTPCDSVGATMTSLKKSCAIAVNTGIENERIILDPGIGFGKPADVDFEILGRLPLFTKLDQPLLVGVSRKAFIGKLLNQDNPAARLSGSLAATAIAVYNGANVIRTHDVRETKMAVQIGEAALQQFANSEV